eukprot:gb/GECG01002052.1/.p1 GENE.gb/GECG01002052.1/~~gb/GECG01002052.1/.p1  ORF type:complete len:433 (+),score=29.00 gb/GECG01002052.1/:1-1299(+)
MTYATPAGEHHTLNHPSTSTMHNGSTNSKVTHGTTGTKHRGKVTSVYRIVLISFVALAVGALSLVSYQYVTILRRTPLEPPRAVGHIISTRKDQPAGAMTQKTPVIDDEFRSKVAHMVESSDAKTLRGLLASLRSAVENSKEPEYLRVYILSAPEDHYDIKKSVQCMMERYNHTKTRKPLSDSVLGYFVIPFNIYEFNPKWQISYREHSDLPNMSSPLNFARMYMHKLLRDKSRVPEPLPEKVVYLDTDTIVHGNINDLYHQTLRNTSYPIAMALRNTKMISLRYYGINFMHPDLVEWNRLYAGTPKAVDPRSPAYNNGVCVHHLLRWAEQNITENIEYWLVANTRKKLYKYGYNAPMLMGVGGRVENISNTWNYASLGWNPRLSKQELLKANILHWTGKRKGWDAKDGLHTHFWSPYNSTICVSNTTTRAN